MQSRIGVGVINGTQLRQQGTPGMGRQLLGAEFPQAQDERPPNRDVLLLLQTLDDGGGLGAEWPKTVDQIAPNPWIIGLLPAGKQRPNLFLLLQPQQGDRRIRLPFRQFFPGVVNNQLDDFQLKRAAPR